MRDKMLNIESQPMMSEERAVATLLSNLEHSGFYPEFTGNEAQARKEKLERVARQMPTIAKKVLDVFAGLAHAEGLEPGKLAFYVVGGRVNATPIKESTDFDVVIAAEHPLNPFAKQETITLRQRHQIASGLYAHIESIFADLQLQSDYERGIIEIKGFGEKTPEEVEEQAGILKITERVK